MKNSTFSIFVILFCLYFSNNAFAQVGIGTVEPHENAILHVESDSLGILIPRMTQAERLSIPVTATSESLWVYVTDVNEGFWYYDGSAWNQIGGSSSGGHWNMSGNNIYNNNAGNVGIGVDVAGGETITAPLHVKGTTAIVEPGGTNTLHENDFSGTTITSEAEGWQCFWSINGDEEAYNGNCDGSKLIEGSFTPSQTSITISFDYNFDSGHNQDSFRVELHQGTADLNPVELISVIGDASGSLPPTVVTVVPGLSYSLHFYHYGKSNSNGHATVDNILVTEEGGTTPVENPTYTFRLQDGTQGAGKILTSDAEGNAYWANPGAGSPTPLQKQALSQEVIVEEKEWVKDYGFANLINGEVHIELNEEVLNTALIDTQNKIYVRTTEQGNSNGLYIIYDADGKGFTVKEKNSGTSNVGFAYAVTARNKHFEAKD